MTRRKDHSCMHSFRTEGGIVGNIAGKAFCHTTVASLHVTIPQYWVIDIRMSRLAEDLRRAREMRTCAELKCDFAGAWLFLNASDQGKKTSWHALRKLLLSETAASQQHVEWDERRDLEVTRSTAGALHYEARFEILATCTPFSIAESSPIYIFYGGSRVRIFPIRARRICAYCSCSVLWVS